MKIKTIDIKQNKENTEITYLIEREKGIYNNIVETVKLTESEIEKLTKNEIKTLGYLRAKPIAIRVFEEIEPLNEDDNPVDFDVILSKVINIEIIGNPYLQIGQSKEYNLIAYDQYGEVINIAESEIIWKNKVVNANSQGTLKVTAKYKALSTFLDVQVVPHVPTKEEQQQELIHKLLLDNLNMQMQLDTVIMSSLEVE